MRNNLVIVFTQLILSDDLIDHFELCCNNFGRFLTLVTHSQASIAYVLVGQLVNGKVTVNLLRYDGYFLVSMPQIISYFLQNVLCVLQIV